MESWRDAPGAPFRKLILNERLVRIINIKMALKLLRGFALIALMLSVQVQCDLWCLTSLSHTTAPAPSDAPPCHRQAADDSRSPGHPQPEKDCDRHEFAEQALLVAKAGVPSMPLETGPAPVLPSLVRVEVRVHTGIADTSFPAPAPLRLPLRI